MPRVTIDNYGRIVIPKPLRERLGLEAGSPLEIEVETIEEGRRAFRLGRRGRTDRIGCPLLRPTHLVDADPALIGDVIGFGVAGPPGSESVRKVVELLRLLKRARRNLAVQWHDPPTTH